MKMFILPRDATLQRIPRLWLAMNIFGYDAKFMFFKIPSFYNSHLCPNQCLSLIPAQPNFVLRIFPLASPIGCQCVAPVVA